MAFTKDLQKRLETLFSDPEQIAEKGNTPPVTHEAPTSPPANDSSAPSREIDTLLSRIRELETQLRESEVRASAQANTVEARPTASILYEKEQVGYSFSSENSMPLRLTTFAASKLDNAIKAPLTASGLLIGEMQIEPPSDRVWSAEEMNLANAVAQQASLQIQNLRLLATTERARAEAQAATRRFTHENWEAFMDGIHQGERIGYVYDQSAVAPFGEAAPVEHDFQAIVNVLDEHVGDLFLKAAPAHPLTDADRALVSAVARQLGQQVENLRLLADASRARAEAEEATRRLTRESWQSYTAQQEEDVLGFVYDSNQVTPLRESPLPQDIAIAQPLKVRGETIGQLAVAGWKNVSPEAAAMVAAIAAQTSIHLETLRLTEELQKRAAELEKLDRLKSAFLANMSHELRTPLNSILGFSDVILEGLDGPLTETMESDLKLINRNGQHLLSLINDVLDMAKIEAGKMNLNIERFNMHEILMDVVNITASLARDKALTLQLEADASPDLIIEADRIRLRQVMINLVGNAIKFTESGSITIFTTRHDGRLRINVRDTGIGVLPEQAQMIFEEFGQVDTSTTRKTGGTGLGLPISRKLIELHGGQLWVESTGVHGEGSTFIIELPVTRETKHD